MDSPALPPLSQMSPGFAGGGLSQVPLSQVSLAGLSQIALSPFPEFDAPAPPTPLPATPGGRPAPLPPAPPAAAPPAPADSPEPKRRRCRPRSAAPREAVRTLDELCTLDDEPMALALLRHQTRAQLVQLLQACFPALPHKSKWRKPEMMDAVWAWVGPRRAPEQ